MKGTVIKRAALWSVVIDLGRDETGRRVRKWHSGYRTKKEAERARIELLSRVDQGTYVEPSKVSLGAFLAQEWLPAKRATLKETTLASYEMHVTKHIVPRIGGIPSLSVGAGHLNAFYADLLADGRRNGSGGLAPSTVQRVHATVHKALADAVRWGRLARNPADRADPPKESTAEMSIWTPEQLRTFLNLVRTDRLFAAWLMAAMTGMRRGELLGLRWSDLDLDAGAVSVRQIRTVARYQVLTQTPKTERGRRTIALDPHTVSALRSYRLAQKEERILLGPDYANQEDLVFTARSASSTARRNASTPARRRSRSTWKARTSARRRRRCALDGRVSLGITPSSSRRDRYCRDKPRTSAASFGVSTSSERSMVTLWPAAISSLARRSSRLSPSGRSTRSPAASTATSVPSRAATRRAASRASGEAVTSSAAARRRPRGIPQR